MRILFLDDAVFADLPGGSRMMTWHLAKGLVERGHEVTLLAPHHHAAAPDEEWAEGIHIIRYPGAGKAAQFIREGRAACTRLWAQGAYDLVHSHFAYASIGPLQAVPPDTAQVRSFYGPWDEECWLEESTNLPKSPVSKRLLYRLRSRVMRVLRHHIEARSLRGSHAVIVLSEQSRREVLVFGKPRALLFKIPGGVDLARFMPAADKEETRRRLNLPLDMSILLSVRRLTPRMGLDNLIEAMTNVSAACPDALLLIGGKGPEQEFLARLIKQRGLDAHVRMIGFISDSDLPLYYQAADVFVLPTVALEGFGLVTVESLACGVPVIGTPIGATPEILTGLEPRLLTQNATPDALAASIIAFLAGEWRPDLTPARLHEYVKEHYTWDRNVQETEQVYHSLLSKS